MLVGIVLMPEGRDLDLGCTVQYVGTRSSLPHDDWEERREEEGGGGRVRCVVVCV